MNDFSFEVETRFAFKNKYEAMKALPFLKECLNHEIEWTTKTFGPQLFESDILLRVSSVKSKNNCKYYIGYKEKDMGSFCNIRLELDEDMTNGLKNSKILYKLGIHDEHISIDNIENILIKNGYKDFMYFEGKSMLGRHLKHDLSLKLMECEYIKYPLLLEIEKKAYSPEEAVVLEDEIRSFVRLFKLTDKVIREEPPLLLYKRNN